MAAIRGADSVEKETTTQEFVGFMLLADAIQCLQFNRDSKIEKPMNVVRQQQTSWLKK